MNSGSRRLGIGLLIAVGVGGLALVVLGTWFLVDANAMPGVFHAMGWIEDPTSTPSPIPTFTQPIPTRQPTPTMVTQIQTVTVTHSPTVTVTPSLTPTLTTTASGLVCPNTYPTHLKVGIRVYASLYPDLPNRIRQEPNTKAAIIGLIKPGEEADTVDGPACSEGWIWWKIKMPNGLTGWTAEGDGKDYWILPK